MGGRFNLICSMGLCSVCVCVFRVLELTCLKLLILFCVGGCVCDGVGQLKVFALSLVLCLMLVESF